MLLPHGDVVWPSREETSIGLAQRSRTARIRVRTSTRTVGEISLTGLQEALRAAFSYAARGSQKTGEFAKFVI